MESECWKSLKYRFWVVAANEEEAWNLKNLMQAFKQVCGGGKLIWFLPPLNNISMVDQEG